VKAIDHYEPHFLLLSHTSCAILIWESNMSGKNEVHQGTLALMILKSLEAIGTQHGYGIARRIEQISGDCFPSSGYPLSGAAEARAGG